MSFKKIKDYESTKPFCLHPEHNPPTMIVLPTGTYEYICPGCKKRFIVDIKPSPSL